MKAVVMLIVINILIKGLQLGFLLYYQEESDMHLI